MKTMDKLEMDKVLLECNNAESAIQQYCDKKRYSLWDFGYLIGFDVPYWELIFLDDDGYVIEYFKGESTDDILNQLK